MSVLNITQENFEEEVLNSKDIVLVDFFAKWCGPCKMLSPVIDKIAEKNIEGLKIGKVDIDDEAELASRFRIMTVPTIAVFKDGKVCVQESGAYPEAKIMEMIQKVK